VERAIVAQGKARLFKGGNPLVYGGALERVGEPYGMDTYAKISAGWDSYRTARAEFKQTCARSNGHTWHLEPSLPTEACPEFVLSCATGPVESCPVVRSPPSALDS
jgi:hypothetical protein